MKRLIVAAVLLWIAGSASAQQWPTRPVRIVVAWPPGSIIDVLARIITEPMSRELGQPLVIDNRAGAAGSIGADQVAQAAPDGYTLLFTSSALNMVSAMGTKTNYKVPDSFTPIVNVVWTPQILVVHPDVKARTPQELVALAKAKPGELFYGTAGNGSPSHFTGELFLAREGIQATPVPFRGSPEAMHAQISGRVAFQFANSSTAMPAIREKRIVPLAVTAKHRLAVAPDVPTMEELGYKDFNASFWNGLLGPAGLPSAIAERMAQAVNKALAMPEVRKRIAPSGNEIDGASNPERMAEMMKRDYAQWADVVRVAHIKAQ